MVPVHVVMSPVGMDKIYESFYQAMLPMLDGMILTRIIQWYGPRHEEQGNESLSPLNLPAPLPLHTDLLVLTNFSLYKQISAIALSRSFPGWLAPLQFEPLRQVNETM